MKGQKNPYVGRLKQRVTIRLDKASVAYFKTMAINLYLRDCAVSHRKLRLKWAS
jgi:hypothetical protein